RSAARRRICGGGRVGPLVGLQPVPGGAAGALPCATQKGLPGIGGPGWRGGAYWALGARRNRAALCAVAPPPGRRVRPPRVATAAGTTPGQDGAVAATWAREPGPKSGGALPGADEVVGGGVDLCPRGWRGANEQCSGAGPAPRGAVAERELRV